MEDEHCGTSHCRPSLGAVGRRALGKRVRAYIGLGANVGDAQANLQRAIKALAALPGAAVRAVSPLYRSKPVGGVEQPDFLNAVVAADVPAGPDPETGAIALLSALKSIEHALGRQPRERWGPREIDLDLLVFGRHQINRRADPWLAVPHPEMRSRLFVLAPLADLVPALSPPGWGESMASAVGRLRPTEPSDAIDRVGDWNADEKSWQM